MTPGQQVTAWAGLRAWVAWLHDRYELAVEERLPRCWASHPGLVEELHALKAWREEIYSSGQPAGQAARYWHAELRQVIHAAAFYAAGCRTGHRTASNHAAHDQDTARQHDNADPLTGIPAAEIVAGRARRAGATATTAAIAAALDAGDAAPVPGTHDQVTWAGGRWSSAASSWFQAPAPQRPRLAAGRPAPATPAGGEADPWTT